METLRTFCREVEREKARSADLTGKRRQSTVRHSSVWEMYSLPPNIVRIPELRPSKEELAAKANEEEDMQAVKSLSRSVKLLTSTLHARAIVNI